MASYLGVIVQFVLENAQHAHWLVFAFLILAGFNLPISEDLMLVVSGMLASTIVPENALKIFAGVFFGCYFSDWIAYWIGRGLGPRLWHLKWFANMVSKRNLCRMKFFYGKYGFWTLLFGRFIPFGVRNCLFITAGMTRMHFGKFLLSDGIACLISNTVLFTLAYSFGKNYNVLLEYLKVYNIVIFCLFVLFSLCSAFFFLRKYIFRQEERV